jgi:hypothetical protein
MGQPAEETKQIYAAALFQSIGIYRTECSQQSTTTVVHKIPRLSLEHRFSGIAQLLPKPRY